jgi:aconitate hydratase
VIEPDSRIVSSEVYPPPRSGGGLSLRTQDPEPRTDGSPRFIVASAETLAYAVATGSVGDPRSFKRPVRVTVPRALPTDDVLVLRDKKGEAQGAKKTPAPPTREPVKDALTLEVLETPFVPAGHKASGDGIALVLATLDDVRWASERPLDRDGVRAVISSFIPSQAVTALAAEAIACFQIDEATLKAAKGAKTVTLSAPGKWPDGAAVAFGKDKPKGTSAYLARGAENTWATSGGLKPTPKK